MIKSPYDTTNPFIGMMSPSTVRSSFERSTCRAPRSSAASGRSAARNAFALTGMPPLMRTTSRLRLSPIVMTPMPVRCRLAAAKATSRLSATIPSTTATSDAAVRVVTLTGAGDKAFCAGADLTGMRADAGWAEVHDGRGELARLFRSMWELGKPIVARVRGYALAGGFGLCLACDFVVAADDAQFGTPEIDVGLWPFMITVPLMRSMPPKVALELMMTGRRVSADEAQRIGFVNRVVPVDDLDRAVG